MSSFAQLGVKKLVDDQEKIKILMNLGLSLNQARIYLTNLHSGPTTAKGLSDASKIGREDVYRTLSILQKKGLITKRLCIPTLFESVSLKTAINFLTKSKKEEFSKLLEKAYFIAENDNEAIQKSLQNVDYKITIASIGEQFIKHIGDTKTNICFTTRYDVAVHLWTDPEHEHDVHDMCRAMNKGVKIRMILDYPESKKEERTRPFYIPAFNKMLSHKNFQYKYITLPPKTILLLLDEKFVSIWTASESFDSMPFILTDNPSIINLASIYFSSLWEQAEEPALKKNN